MYKYRKNMVSVIISVLNENETISACLESIIYQDYKSIEIILIDGGSKDGTLKIIENYAKFITYQISEPDTGIFNAWNKGLIVAKGEWICFLGADDFFASVDSISNIISFAKYPDINYISGKIALLDLKDKQVNVVGRPYCSDSLKYGMLFSHPGSLHHISLFCDYGLFNEKYKIAGDFDFFLRCHDSILPAFSKVILVNMGVNGISNRKKIKAIYEGYQALSNNKDFGFFIGVRFFVIAFVKLLIKKVYLLKLPLIKKSV